MRRLPNEWLSRATFWWSFLEGYARFGINIIPTLMLWDILHSTAKEGDRLCEWVLRTRCVTSPLPLISCPSVQLGKCPWWSRGPLVWFRVRFSSFLKQLYAWRLAYSTQVLGSFLSVFKLPFSRTCSTLLDRIARKESSSFPQSVFPTLVSNNRRLQYSLLFVQLSWTESGSTFESTAGTCKVRRLNWALCNNS